MKPNKALIFLFLALVPLSCSVEDALEQPSAPTHVKQTHYTLTQENVDSRLYYQGSLVVKLSERVADLLEGKSSNPFAPALEKLGITTVERLFPYAGEYEARTRNAGLHTYYLVRFDSKIPLGRAIDMLSALPGVENCSKRHVRKLSKTNDTKWSDLWEYNGNYGINAEYVWQNYTTGNPNVVVCVVDEGVEMTHPDLSWNCGDKSYNFVREGAKITPGDHGTHVAGTIAAVGNNKLGIVGIAGGDYATGHRGVTIISAAVFNGDDSASDVGFERAIKWGADNGALISQNSWGNYYDYDDDGVLSDEELKYARNDKIDEPLAKAIDYFIANAGCDANGNQRSDSPMKGGVVCFAAGNDGIPYGVPADYAPVIAVGATTMFGRLASFSNYGEWVDICAPGSDICSTVTKGKYDIYDGTSMACPHVSGALALILSYFGRQGFTNEQLKEILYGGAKSNFIKTSSSKKMGPYLDLEGAFRYGVAHYPVGSNHDPVIATDYTGSFEFRQWENVSIQFKISDPDGDDLDLSFDPGKGSIATFDKKTNTFRLDATQVKDFETRTATISVLDGKGGKAEFRFDYKVVETLAPRLLRSPSEIVFSGAGKSHNIDIASFFSDPNGDSLEYLVEADGLGFSNGPLIKNGKLYFNAKTACVTPVTVTADKSKSAGGFSGTASVTFNLVVRDDNYDFDFYPNPVRSDLYIRPGSASAVDVSVRVCSSTGELVWDDVCRCSLSSPARIDMAACPLGQYSLNVRIGDKEYNEVIIKLP